MKNQNRIRFDDGEMPDRKQGDNKSEPTAEAVFSARTCDGFWRELFTDSVFASVQAGAETLGVSLDEFVAVAVRRQIEKAAVEPGCSQPTPKQSKAPKTVALCDDEAEVSLVLFSANQGTSIAQVDVRHEQLTAILQNCCADNYSLPDMLSDSVERLAARAYEPSDCLMVRVTPQVVRHLRAYGGNNFKAAKGNLSAIATGVLTVAMMHREFIQEATDVLEEKGCAWLAL